MGQYFLTININKTQFLDPHKFGDGLKLMEFASSSQGTLMALAILLADGNGRGGGDLSSDKQIIGSWCGDRIVIAGDYADDGQFLPEKWFDIPIMDSSRLEEKNKGAKLAGEVFPAGKPPNLYTLARLCFADVSELAIDAIRDDGYSKYSPNEDNFLESTMWVKDEVKISPRKGAVDLPFLTKQNLQRVLYFASERGQAYFDPYVKWLLKQNLPPETADLLGRCEWYVRDGFPEKYIIRD